MRRLTVFAVLGLCACAGTGKGSSAPTVSDADFGRLQPGQTGPVDEARRFLASARDEQARAKLRLQEVQHQDDLAKADATAARAAAARAAAQAKAADDSRDPAQLEQARALKEQADAEKRAADARDTYAKQLKDARQASVDAASAQVDLGDARVELAKVQALQQAGIPAASRYDAGKFQARVDDARKSFQAALQKARDAESKALASQQAWSDAQRQAQAIPTGAAAPTGTGLAQPTQ
jgi:colicin import membrane protein